MGLHAPWPYPDTSAADILYHVGSSQRSRLAGQRSRKGPGAPWARGRRAAPARAARAAPRARDATGSRRPRSSLTQRRTPPPTGQRTPRVGQCAPWPRQPQARPAHQMLHASGAGLHRGGCLGPLQAGRAPCLPVQQSKPPGDFPDRENRPLPENCTPSERARMCNVRRAPLQDQPSPVTCRLQGRSRGGRAYMRGSSADYMPGCPPPAAGPVPR